MVIIWLQTNANMHKEVKHVSGLVKRKVDIGFEGREGARSAGSLAHASLPGAADELLSRSCNIFRFYEHLISSS